MIKILFVCHGNICRSPMAEFIMKDIVKKEGILEKFEIASAATSTEEIGSKVYPPARKILAENNISCEGKTARQITREDYSYYNYIVAMDSRNIKNLSPFVGDDTENKVSLLMDYTDNPKDVADPWYTGDFETTFRDIKSGCRGLLAYIKKRFNASTP